MKRFLNKLFKTDVVEQAGKKAVKGLKKNPRFKEITDEGYKEIIKKQTVKNARSKAFNDFDGDGTQIGFYGDKKNNFNQPVANNTTTRATNPVLENQIDIDSYSKNHPEQRARRSAQKYKDNYETEAKLKLKREETEAKLKLKREEAARRSAEDHMQRKKGKDALDERQRILKERDAADEIEEKARNFVGPMPLEDSKNKIKNEVTKQKDKKVEDSRKYFTNENIKKTVGLGVGGAIVFNMFDKGGQMSNAELYGQQQPYGY